MSGRTTVTMIAGRNSRGEAVFEEVLVDDIGADQYRVVATPALVLGIARDDIVQLYGEETPPTVLHRGGYVSLQIHGDHAAADSIAEDLRKIEGRLDGRAPHLSVFSVPMSVGFAEIERLANALVTRQPEVEWYFGNVYADDGVTPLNWWKSTESERRDGA